jgi:phage baseplate assembly protein W
VRNVFVGRGWGFPLRVDPNGSIALVSDEREIEEAIRIVLATTPGERPMRPLFGCAIHEHVFDMVTPVMMNQVVGKVTEALELWEPRITVDLVECLPDANDPALIYTDIRYRINDTNSPRNLVFPFYTIPGE